MKLYVIEKLYYYLINLVKIINFTKFMKIELELNST